MSNQIDRRRFLASGAAVAGMANLSATGAIATPQPAQAGSARVRYSAYDSRARLDSYAKGVTQMKAWGLADPNDPRGWEYQAAIHKSYRPDNGIFNQCPHGSWWFFPWHRAYLYFFEQIVREASKDEDFTLPYWDWDAEGRKSLPVAFCDPPSALYNKKRAPNINAGEPLKKGDTDPTGALRNPEFLGPTFRPGFGGVFPPNSGLVEGPVESSVHDGIHGLVGGPIQGMNDMSNLETAALDPIFWLHHANIDRIWDVWLSSGRTNPSDGDWLRNNVDGNPSPWIFFDGAKTRYAVTTSEFLPGGTRLDYRYDDIRGNSQSLLADSNLRQKLRSDHKMMITALGANDRDKIMKNEIFGDQNQTHVMVTNPVVGVMLRADPVTIQASIDPAKRAALNQAIPLAVQANQDSPAVLLNIENVRANASPGVVYRIYLNQKTADAKTNPDDANYVGSIALFLGATGGHAKMGTTAHAVNQGKNYSFDISRLIQSLKSRGQWDDNTFDVTFVASGVGGENQPGSTVTFDRVSISIDR